MFYYCNIQPQSHHNDLIKLNYYYNYHRLYYSIHTMKALHKHNHPNCEPFEQERCHYRQIIDQLISENERLKQQLLLLTDLKNSPPDIHRAETKEDDGSNSYIRKSQPGENHTVEQKRSICEAAIKTNKDHLPRLKQNQLAKMSQRTSHFEIKIEELTSFLNIMKEHQIDQQPSLLSPKNQEQPLQIAKIVQVMQDVIRMFESDRSVLISKIEQLVLLIAAYDRKERQYLQRERQIELELSIAQEQLVIFKRLKKTK